ncbi:lytic transglycosylase domain-containing protein [Stackebrandtia nassauensis]|uniref:Transglycosylase SLT domain-containing protein n=1 Tax=Stackebrandtia nassauensis (strain DSM 44728 / CIP 108903 / NRRL B-16338 / NBRC 102104 / LLR-40K-21) TaxID=446470 RepID=D3Q7U0_STANL|nr:lytic transglycosylase domain-containing protein [Stackebrandtia nassauensis]ADD40445.1 hypothetical protein Snas_0733 [Stackebrandtia nassauensis DSM 44728]
MNDAPEENVEPTRKTSRGQRLRGWVTSQPRLRLGLVGVVALALVAGAWTGVSYASNGSEPAAAKPSATADAGDSQSLSPEPHPSTAPEKEKTEKEKKPKPKATEEEEKPKTEAPAPGCDGFSGNQLTACKMLDDHGFGTDQMDCLSQLWDHESGWNHQASNGSSGAYGIPQALPGDKMASAGSDWSSNPATQIEWGLGYIADRYGNPCGAWGFWQSNNYY